MGLLIRLTHETGRMRAKTFPTPLQLFDPTSNHYGDSFIGFAVTIVIWSFALAAIYDWNLLFDSFPGNIAGNLYRLIVLVASIALWLHADRKE